MASAKVLCPGCGGWKTVRALLCRECFAPDTAGARMAVRPREIGGPMRTIDFERLGSSSWRPPHLPPACSTCHGFGYVQGSSGEPGGSTGVEHHARARTDRARGGSTAGGWHSCPACLEHPGSSMPHTEWTTTRGKQS